jgi:hypothetical protein
LGKHSSAVGAFQCESCADGTAAPVIGLSDCPVCSSGSTNDANRTNCICEASTYKILSTAVVGGYTCEACPLGASCEAAGADASTIQPSKYTRYHLRHTTSC